MFLDFDRNPILISRNPFIDSSPCVYKDNLLHFYSKKTYFFFAETQRLCLRWVRDAGGGGAGRGPDERGSGLRQKYQGLAITEGATEENENEIAGQK